VWPPTVRPGDWLCLTIENRTHLEINFAVLDLQADWSIAQMYPTGAFLPLGGGKCEPIPFQVTWPYRLPQGREHFKIFGCLGNMDLHWLELPALGEPPIPGSRHRGLAPEPYPEHAWTVVDLSFEVKR
jgi:hypothetical protein